MQTGRKHGIEVYPSVFFPLAKVLVPKGIAHCSVAPTTSSGLRSPQNKTQPLTGKHLPAPLHFPSLTTCWTGHLRRLSGN